jgi:serine/threonine-protein kinase
MENLQGGTLALEHRYTIDSAHTRVGFISRYQATQSPFDVPVWVDVFDALGDIPEPEPVIDRLESTARRTASLSGDGILQVCDYGELDRNVPFVVSERVLGQSLASRIDDEPLDQIETARLIRRLADILSRAHNQGVCHGRLAPRWIYLADGDLESACIGHFEIGPTLGELRRMENVVLTPAMVDAFPPEAFDRPTRPPDIDEDAFDPTRVFTEAGDAYALGLVAYSCLIGHHPFFDPSSTDASEGIARIQHEQPQPPESFGVDPEVSDCVLRALAPDPDDRWPSPTDFAEALCRQTGVGSPAAGEGADRPMSASDRHADASAPENAAEDETMSPGQSTAPGPASRAMTIAVAALLLTNVCWFLYWYLDGSPAGGGNIQLDSRPSGAAVHRSDPSGETIGRTPISIQASTRTPRPLKLFIDKPGFAPTTVTVSETDQARNLAVHLMRQTGADSSSSDGNPGASETDAPTGNTVDETPDGGLAPDVKLQ